MEKAFSKLKAEAGRIDLPDECEENDRAVKYLALETGVGHYDDLNLLVMAVLIIFISVTFLAVNGGKINDEESVGFSLKTFLSGEFTAELEKKYIEGLPMTEGIRAAEERVSLLYGIGNTLTERSSGNYGSGGRNDRPDPDYNAFEPDDSFSENAVTTRPVQTDKNGNTVTQEENAETAPGGGTTAVSRPTSTQSSTTVTDEDEEEGTTTHNEAPDVTTTTTSMADRHTTAATLDTDTTEPPTDTEPTDTEPTETDPPADTEPSETEPPAEDEPEEW